MGFRLALLARLALVWIVITSPRAWAFPGQPLLLGVFPQAELTQPAAIEELAAIDAWTAAVGGAGTSIAGTFLDLEVGNPDFNVVEQLEAAWQAGYTPLVKMGAQRTAAAVAGGAADAGITGWARAYAAWVGSGNGRFAFLAPLPEANYFASATYTLDPVGYQQSFRRIVDIFEREGVDRSKVRWVFAPNGWTEPGDPEWEEYYPGDAIVDVVGFSQYNWGFCAGTLYDFWLDPRTTPASDQLFGKYIARMKALAPNRPIFVLQTATTAQSPTTGAFDGNRKSEWLRNAYSYFAEQGVRAVMYFNRDKECDWAFFKSVGQSFEGYRDAAAEPGVDYVAPAALSTLTLLPDESCVPTDNVRCLQGGRFRVEVRWRDSNSNQTATAPSVPQGTADSGLFRFWDPANWEILVKVLDGCGANGNGHFWVYSAAATDRAYVLVVTDTVTGKSRSYSNVQGTRASPILDSQAFATCSGSAPVARLASAAVDDGPTTSADVEPDGETVPLESRDRGAADAASGCAVGTTAACLQGSRFRVEVDWQREPGAPLEPATLAPAGTADSGIFTFYGPENWEILLKVLDGCGANGNGRYWVFAAAATDRGFTIRVTDMDTGATWEASNPFGVIPRAIADTSAFATCP